MASILWRLLEANKSSTPQISRSPPREDRSKEEYIDYPLPLSRGEAQSRKRNLTRLLGEAVRKEDYREAEDLLRKGAQITEGVLQDVICTNNGESLAWTLSKWKGGDHIEWALWSAVECDFIDSIEELLKWGVYSDRVVLATIAILGEDLYFGFASLEALIQGGIEVRRYGWKVIEMICEHRTIKEYQETALDFIEIFVRKGTMVTDRAFVWAARRNADILLDYFIKTLGADIHASTNAALIGSILYLGEDETPYATRVLLEAGANIHARHSKALRAALELGNLELIELLLSHGARGEDLLPRGSLELIPQDLEEYLVNHPLPKKREILDLIMRAS